jgi:hypothetical protein
MDLVFELVEAFLHCLELLLHALRLPGKSGRSRDSRQQ